MNSAAPSLAVLLVTHNSVPWIEGFARTWRETLAASQLVRTRGVQVIVADSGSTDRTREVVARSMPGAKVLDVGNIGYGAAMNRAAAAAGSAPSHLLICNPDLTFSEPFARTLLDPLFDQVRADPVWQLGHVIAPRLANPDGTLQPSIGEFPTLRGLWADQKRPRDRRKYVWPQPTEPGMVDWASGACMVITRQAFESVGGFDEGFFLYVEEVDLQRRLHDAGYPTWFAPEAHVVHHQPNASRPPRPEVQRWAARGLLRYFACHGTIGQLAGYRAMALASRRLPLREALAPRRTILAARTGPE